MSDVRRRSLIHNKVLVCVAYLSCVHDDVWMMNASYALPMSAFLTSSFLLALPLTLAIAAPLVASADIRITEVMYDADGTDAKREWVELYNGGSEPVDISKWKFTDKSNHVINVPPKNGGSGSSTLAPGAYVILASDAATFSQEHPGVQSVLDTTMSLNNAASSISILNGTVLVDSVSYTKTQGASDDGDSLQLNAGMWIHARPTPGSANASTPSQKAVAAPVKAVPQTKTVSKKQPSTVVETVPSEEVSDDPLQIVNATPTLPSAAQTAAAGSLGGSNWWIALAALALGTGAAVSLISQTKRGEWDIEES